MPKIEFVCSGCGAKVLRYPSQISRADMVFCTRACRNKNYKKANPDWHPPNYKEYRHICLNCGSEFVKTGSCFKPHRRMYCSKACKAKHMPRKPHSEATKAKLSAAAVRQSRNYRSNHMYSGPKGNILMKSSWEVKYAHWLDSQGEDWTYEPEFKLSNGYIYLPDFRLSSGDIIVEVKGYMREDAQKKWDMFCADYPHIKKILITKSDMKKLGLI